MQTEQMSGNTITVTYAISEERSDLDEATARELIRSNAPSGFDVQNVELHKSESTS